MKEGVMEISGVWGMSITLFKPYEKLTSEDFDYGFQRKFMAQINLVRIGTP